jgi:hypothetical protein
MDPLFEREGKWYFWDETWSGYHGPYDTKEIVLQALKEYAENL